MKTLAENEAVSTPEPSYLALEPFIQKNVKIGRISIGLKRGDEIILHCIGSGKTEREAKACALRNLRQMRNKIVGLKDVPITLNNPNWQTDSQAE